MTEKKTEYVCGFLFTHHAWAPSHDVLLIRKKRPKWQEGRLNGVGGHIEPGETPLEAMDREFDEEAGIAGIEWQPVAVLHGPDFVVHFFSAIVPSHVFSTARDGTDEWLETHSVSKIATIPGVLPNLRFLIPLALDESGIVKPVVLQDGIVDAANAG